MMSRCGLHLSKKKLAARAKDKCYVDSSVTVCDSWLTFANFLADMGERPEGLTLDRLDWSKGYEPGNCRWATRKQQTASIMAAGRHICQRPGGARGAATRAAPVHSMNAV